jgi:hypothetical protein
VASRASWRGGSADDLVARLCDRQLRRHGGAAGAPSTLVAGWPVVGREWVACNPTRPDRHPGSFSINLASGRWADFATGDKGGDVVSLAAYLGHTGQAAAARHLAKMLGVA